MGFNLKTFWEGSIRFTKLPGVHGRKKKKVKTAFSGMFQPEAVPPARSRQKAAQGAEWWLTLGDTGRNWAVFICPRDGHCPHSLIYTLSIRWKSRKQRALRVCSIKSSRNRVSTFTLLSTAQGKKKHPPSPLTSWPINPDSSATWGNRIKKIAIL